VFYNASPATAIVESQGAKIEGVRSLVHTIAFGLEYVTPLEGLAISANLPLLGLKYQGSDSEFIVAHGSLDDGKTHFVLQDFRADIRYAPIQDLFALAINIGGSIPTQDYETQGFASVGRGTKRLHMGLSIGRTLEPILPRLYFHAQYEFTLSEGFKTDFTETGDYAQHSSSIAAQIGYFILPSLQINVATDIRLSHGGIDFVAWNDLPEVARDFHDGILKENVYLIGGGIGWEVVRGLTINAIARIFIGGKNTRNAHIFGGGVSYQIF
jgi:hypothetical protein